MTRHRLIALLFAVCAVGLSACATTARQPQAAPASRPNDAGMAGGKPAEGKPAEGKSNGTAAAGDDLDEYSVTGIADPLEPLNRVIFVVNDGLYTVVMRPIARGYETVVPKPLRRGLHNIFENARFPIRFVNSLLQARVDQAGRETGKFLVNTTAGLGGILRVSDRVPALLDVPSADTGQTFAKWGVKPGIYLVLPVVGPNSLRDTVGFAGDAALNPVTWIGFLFGGGYFWGGPAWTTAVTGANTLRSLPNTMNTYDAATANALDKYLAARSSWVQYREAKAKE